MLLKHSDENIVLQAVMDEFEENREKGNLTAELLNREKVTDLKYLTYVILNYGQWIDTHMIYRHTYRKVVCLNFS